MALGDGIMFLGVSDYIRDIYFATLNRISSLFDEKEFCQISSVIEDEKELFLRLEQIYFKGREKNPLSSSPIPLRLFKAPLAMRSIIGDMTSYEKKKFYGLRSKYPGYPSLDDYLIYEADGKRTVADIARRVYFQTGVECGDYAEEFFEMLSDIGLIKLTNS